MFDARMRTARWCIASQGQSLMRSSHGPAATGKKNGSCTLAKTAGEAQKEAGIQALVKYGWVAGHLGGGWEKMQLQRSHAQALQSPGSRFGARAVGRNDRQTRPAWTSSRTQDEASLAGTRARWGSHGGVLHCCSSCLPSEATLEWRLISATRRQRPWIDKGDPKGAGVWGAKGLLRAFDAALDPLHRGISPACSLVGATRICHTLEPSGESFPVVP